MGPIFIAGSSRSGTTMLARILGRSPALHTLSELHFFEELWSPSDGTGELPVEERRALATALLHRARVGYNLPQGEPDDPAEVDELAEAPATAVALFRRFLDREAGRTGARRPVEQTPRNAFVIRQILDLFPDARVVSIVRDPRDVALSQRNWWKRRRLGSTNLTWRTTVRRFLAYHPVTIGLIWRSTVRATDSVDDDRHLPVRFEDLVADPADVVGRICDHVGVPFGPELLEVSATSSSNRADDEAAEGIDPTVSGRWRHDLPAADRWVVERVTGTEMVAHGYQPVGGSPGPGIVRTALAFPLKAGLALVTNLGRTRHPVRSVLARIR